MFSDCGSFKCHQHTSDPICDHSRSCHTCLRSFTSSFSVSPHRFVSHVILYSSTVLNTCALCFTFYMFSMYAKFFRNITPTYNNSHLYTCMFFMYLHNLEAAILVSDISMCRLFKKFHSVKSFDSFHLILVKMTDWISFCTSV
jgi:hypothetical protein